MMNAIMEAKQLYTRYGLDFERDLGFYLAHGLVVSRPDRFLMAKMISKNEGDDSWNPQAPDCWYVHCAVGKGALEWFLLQAPVRMPFLSWRRFKDGKNSLRTYRTEQFERFA